MCPKIEIRCLGDDYGKVIIVDLLSVNRESITILLPEGQTMNFSLDNGYDVDYNYDKDHTRNYNSYQLNLDSLVFDKSYNRDTVYDTVRKTNDITNAGNV